MKVLLLHGFAGTPAAWDAIAAPLERAGHVAIRPYVGGHGGRPLGASFTEEVDRLAGVVRSETDGPLHVGGYSLGGRLAFGLLARHAALVSGATIVSANPGLADESERPARAAGDDRWADLIAREGIERFITEWERQPLFASQAALPAEVRALQHAWRTEHDAAALAEAMRTLSLARMPDFTPALADVDLPVTLVTGSLDAKFDAIAKALAPRLRRATHVVVPGAGHNVILERPEAVADVLLRSLS